MYLRNIAISNYHTFTYHPELTLTKGMEFDTDAYTSNVNILVGPNGSGKSNFLDLLTLLCNLHSPLSAGEGSGVRLKKHPGFESYPTTILAQRVIGGADEHHHIIVKYNLDEMTHEILENPSSITASQIASSFTYHHIGIDRVNTMQQRQPGTIKLIQEHLGLMYNHLNQSYMTSGGAIRKREDLGSGERALLSIIDQILTHNCVGGMVLIDEPELHLHPQYQRHLGDILETLSQQCNSQIILATHSPFFINDLNIENVFRFALRDGHSHIINPVDFRGQEQARIKQILTDGNMSKLFFTDIIIMVEGDTDEYFLHKYIREYFAQHNIQSRYYNYEILNIAGKSSLYAWRNFCNQFQIQWSFIGDWDNVISTSPFGSQIEQIKSSIPHHEHGKKLTKSQQYQALIEKISNQHPELAKHINHRLSLQEHKHIHILHHGDLEAYLGLHDKGLDITIDWCSTHLQNRLLNPHYQHYRDDLNNILKNIFHVKSD